ncbi:helix-turn-helix transcriptional regulator [Mucilaginibacter sp. cycad4]|uniref:AraC family transcriptional regulator n=1 Tax=Mucilaginibacter sp. cycad4 TaxID=3342096 RepID=UPI002AAB1682|nr:helix-turn-helix transcriptional regulator [Mucilaginibacter gossypii]WPV01309.1 helix-turn-helix transcriptional regulator [Mucilaginibacter gossypii]
MLQSIPTIDICTLADDIKQDEILISRFAPYLDAHKNLFFPHRHSFYHLVLFTDGGGWHTIDFESFDVKPGQVYFMIPGQVHSWDFKGFTDGYIINFSSSFIQSFLLRSGYFDNFYFLNGNPKDEVIDLPADQLPLIISLFEKIIAEVEKPATLGSDMVKLLMLQIFILISRCGGKGDNFGKQGYNQTLIRNFQKLIEQHYIDVKLPKDYAELLYITPNHLNAVCKDVLGLSAGEVIRNRTLLEAKRLLTNPRLSISEIAFNLNFSDNSYFTKFFKKIEGITPEEFRKKTLNNKS